MKVIYPFIFVLLLQACSTGASFSLTNCDVRENVLFVAFKNSDALRNLSIDNQRNEITFKGTTLQDGKWRSPLDKIKKLELDENNLLKLTLSNTDILEVGVVSVECKVKMADYLGNHLIISGT